MKQREAKLQNRTIVKIMELKHLLDNQEEYRRRFNNPVVKHDDKHENVVRVSFDN